MNLVLDLDNDSNYIYIMDKNYDGSGRTRDIMAFEFTRGSMDEIRGQYFLSKMSRPLNEGKLAVIGVDIV
jgi:hypothetical protein